MVDPATLVKAGVAVLSNEKTRKAAGWGVVAVLSPNILLVAFFCSLGSAASGHNITAVELCFHGGPIPPETPAEYRAYIEKMQACFFDLDTAIDSVNGMTEGGTSLDETRVKAIFYALYFGVDDPGRQDAQGFVNCFATFEERTRTVTTTDEAGNEVPVEETYTVAIPIEDISKIYQNIAAATGVPITPEQQSNADAVYNLIHYGAAGGGSGFAGFDVPFIGADGFCSPVGANWRSIVTSEFGNRRDPFTGERRGHTGIDLAVPTGTSIRAALPGTVTRSKYNAGGYGYYAMIDHGGGLSTLYGHCSQLLVREGQTVEAGDIIALSGSTGRSTGPHLHFEVRVNGERTDPRSYLP